MTRLIATLGIFVLAASALAQTPDNCSRWLGKQCAERISPILQPAPREVEQKPVIYTLEPPPDPGTTYRIIRNGTELIQGRDYQVDGNTLNFLPSLAPTSHEVLNSFFIEKLPQDQSVPVSGKFPQQAQTYSVNDICEQILRSQLDYELAHLPQTPGASNSAEETLPSQKPVSSLQMLSRLMVSHRNKGAGRTQAETGQHGIAEGAEGLGDEAVLSVYEQLDPTALMKIGIVSSGASKSDNEGRAPLLQHHPQSIRMLLEKLLPPEDPSSSSETSR